MTFKKLPADEVHKVRTVRLNDRIHDMIVANHGNLANYLRKYEHTLNELKKLSK